VTPNILPVSQVTNEEMGIAHGTDTADSALLSFVRKLASDWHKRVTRDAAISG
jgi:hypothetical protein